jgi:hypothetical protein
MSLVRGVVVKGLFKEKKSAQVPTFSVIACLKFKSFQTFGSNCFWFLGFVLLHGLLFEAII